MDTSGQMVSIPEQLREDLEEDIWVGMKQGNQIADGSFLTILYNDDKLVAIRFTSNGYFLSRRLYTYQRDNW